MRLWLRGNRRATQLDRQSRNLLSIKPLYALAALALFGACTASLSARQPAATFTLLELTWFPKSVDRVTALTSRPVACVSPGGTAEERTQISIGKLAFNSPALLGGQAEKKGLSCGSCHQNGRGNPLFQFEAVSGAPGTADVTSGLFSRMRADNVFNPLPIPDLASSDGQNQVERKDRAAFSLFVRGQIEEEFSGDPPPPRIFKALLTYLEHVDETASACDINAREPRTWQQDWNDAQHASDLIIATENEAEITFYTRTARIALRRIYERYPAAQDSEIRKTLIALSRNLAAGERLGAQNGALHEMLEAADDRSLYAPQTLAKALAE